MGVFDVFRSESSPLVEQALRTVEKMLEDGELMFAAATASLLENEILELDLQATDHGINTGEQDLRRLVLEHLSITPNRELVFSLKLISIVHEAERIGDLAKSLAKLRLLAHKPRLGADVANLRSFRDRVQNMFTRTLTGFTESNRTIAKKILQEHERIKDDVAKFLQELADREDITPNQSMIYAMSAHLMSRVSSHLANIVSTVVCPFDQIHRMPQWLMEQDENQDLAA